MLNQIESRVLEERCPHCGSVVSARAVSPYCNNCRGLLRYSIPGSPVGDIVLLRPGEKVVGGDDSDPAKQHLYVVQPGTLHCNEATLTTIYRATPESLLKFQTDFEEPIEVETVAIKEFVDDPRQGSINLREYRDWIETLLQIRHPSILRTYQERTFGPRHLLFQKYIEGQTLSERYFNGVQERQILGSRGLVGDTPEQLISENELYPIALQLAESLCYLHHELNPPFLHCDLTPYNVMISPDGHCTVIDLGRPGKRMRSAHYAPIELYDLVPDLKPTDRTDQYLLGTLLFSVACGVPASAVIPHFSDEPIIIEAPKRWEYERGNPDQGMRQLPLRRFRPDFSEGFCQWIEQLMAVHPQDRFPSDEAMLQSLQSLRQPAERKQKSTTRPRSPLRRILMSPFVALWLLLRWIVKGILKRLLFFSLVGLLFIPPVRASLYQTVVTGAGDALLRVGRLKEAWQLFKQLPDEDAAKYYHRARVQLALGQEWEALQSLRRAKWLRPDWQPVRHAIGETAHQLLEGWQRDAQSAAKSGDYAKAMAAYKQIVRFAPYQASAWKAMGQLAERHRDNLSAIRYWKQYAMLQPQAVDGRVALARLYADRGYITKAYWQSVKAAQLNQNSAPLQPASNQLLRDVLQRVARLCAAQAASIVRNYSNPQQRLNGQLLWLKRAVELNPNSATYRFQYGGALLKDQKYSSALEQLQRCRALQPKYPKLQEQIALCYKKMGKP